MSEMEALPEVVYHYTSMDTMTKIVENRYLWATAIAYLNDSNEQRFLIQRIMGRLKEWKEIGKDLNMAIDLDGKYDLRKSQITSIADQPFVVSFAAASDSLMHWRSYCPSQSGVAIGFKSHLLRKAEIGHVAAPGSSKPVIELGEVAYLDIENDHAIDEIIQRRLEAAEGAARNTADFAVNTLFWIGVEATACGKKDAVFNVEGEYRLMIFNINSREEALRFRTVRSTLVPYVPVCIPNGHLSKLDSPWEAIDSITVGPSANIDLTLQSVDAFFKVRKMNVKVQASRIPYRDW